MYTIQIPSCFFFVITLLCTTDTQKNISVLSLVYNLATCSNYSIPNCVKIVYFFWKGTQKSKYFKNKTFFLQKKKEKHYLYIKGNFMLKKRFAANVIFSRRPQNQKKKKKCWEKSFPPRQMLPPKCNLPFW